MHEPQQSAHAGPAIGEEPEDDLELVAANEDRGAFVRLFEHFAPRLKSFFRRGGAVDAQAEELVQEVMLTVWRRARQFDRSRARASTWIFTIARNRAIDAFRHERRPDPAPLLSLDEVPEPEDERSPGADEIGVSTPEAEYSRMQQAERIAEAMRTLPPEQAQLVKLSFFEEIPHGQLAERLGLPLGTVKSRLRLAMGKLRVALAPVDSQP